MNKNTPNKTNGLDVDDFMEITDIASIISFTCMGLLSVAFIGSLAWWSFSNTTLLMGSIVFVLGMFFGALALGTIFAIISWTIGISVAVVVKVIQILFKLLKSRHATTSL